MQKDNKNKGVISLIFILIVGFFILSLGFMAISRAVLELQKNRNTLSGDQSFYAAESAAKEGLYQYRYLNNPAYSPPSINNFGVQINQIPPASNKIEVNSGGTTMSGEANNNFNSRNVIYGIDSATKQTKNWSEQ